MQKIELNGKTILVTGGAGFIGSNLIRRLFVETKGATIINIDNLNAYYDTSLKDYRLEVLEQESKRGDVDVSYTFVKGDIANKALIDKLFDEYHFDVFNEFMRTVMKAEPVDPSLLDFEDDTTW